MKRTTYFLALVFTIAFAGTAFGGVVFSDDFESYNVGNFPSKWNLQFSGDTIEVVGSPVASGSKALKFKGAVGWAANIYRNNEMPQGNVTVEADVWTVSAMSGDRDTVTIWYNGACVAFCTQGPSLTAYFGDSTYNGSFQSESWHHVKMEIDWDSSRYKAYIDNTLYYDGTFTKRNSPANKRNLWLHASNSAESTRIGYWDNIVVRDNEPEPPVVAHPEPPITKVETFGDMITISCDPATNTDGYILVYADFPYAEGIHEYDMKENTSLAGSLPETSAFYVAFLAYNEAGRSDYSNIEYFAIPPKVQDINDPNPESDPDWWAWVKDLGCILAQLGDLIVVAKTGQSTYLPLLICDNPSEVVSPYLETKFCPVSEFSLIFNGKVLFGDPDAIWKCAHPNEL